MAKKIFIIRLRLTAASTVFEMLHSAMWISDYRLAYFSALFGRVTLAAGLRQTERRYGRRDASRKSSTMTHVWHDTVIV
jgi:hypothetical protein